MQILTAYFGMGFTLGMSYEQAEFGAHQGKCDDDVLYLESLPAIREQLDGREDEIRAELKEYGAWTPRELQDDEQNRLRILWLAAGDIKDSYTHCGCCKEYFLESDYPVDIGDGLPRTPCCHCH